MLCQGYGLSTRAICELPAARVVAPVVPAPVVGPGGAGGGGGVCSRYLGPKKKRRLQTQELLLILGLALE
jgi:hypothetical protein